MLFLCTRVYTCRCCRGLGYMDDKSLERLSVLFPRLSSIELRLCSVTDAGLLRFCRHSQRNGGLQSIVLDHAGPGITDQAVRTIADHSPSLLHLTLAHCPSVSNTALRSVYMLLYIRLYFMLYTPIFHVFHTTVFNHHHHHLLYFTYFTVLVLYLIENV